MGAKGKKRTEEEYKICARTDSERNSDNVRKREKKTDGLMEYCLQAHTDRDWSMGTLREQRQQQNSNGDEKLVTYNCISPSCQPLRRRRRTRKTRKRQEQQKQGHGRQEEGEGGKEQQQPVQRQKDTCDKTTVVTTHAVAYGELYRQSIKYWKTETKRSLASRQTDKGYLAKKAAM